MHSLAAKREATFPSEELSSSQLEEDRGLLVRVLNGEKEAYRIIVEKYQKRAFHLAFEIVRSREDAEDIVQESFVKAYLSLPEFKQEAAFYTWLYRIVYNMAIDHRRRVARRGGAPVEFDEKVLSPDKDEDPALSSVLDNNILGNRVAGPHEALARKEQAKRLHGVLNELSDEHRAAIVLREVDGLSYDEIARVTGVAKGTVMSRLHYARKRLQSALREDS